MYILVYLFWIILNGSITAEILLVGLALTAAVGLLLYVLFGYTPKRDLLFLKRLPLFIVYLFVLSFEILKASFAMFRFVLGARSSIEPVLVTFRSGLKTKFGRYILANSITLTPGTITIDVDGDVFTVHCLTRRMLDTSENNVFIRFIRKMEA